MDAYAFVHTSWGILVIGARDEKLAALIFPSVPLTPLKRRIQRKWPDAQPRPNLFPSLQRRIQQYFDNRRVAFNAPIDLSGKTLFQKQILSACKNIPYGCTLSYGQLAAEAGYPHAARAVGAVMAANPIPLVIPCHRVVRADGGLGGFSAPGGLTLKKKLLELEARSASHLRPNPPHKHPT